MTDAKILEIDLQCLGDLSLSSTLPDDVIIEPGNPLEIEKCKKLEESSAAATALYVVAKAIERKWRWLRVSRICNNLIEISVPRDRENIFANLMQKRALERVAMQDFEDMETNLEGIMEDNLFQKYGESVLELIKEFRIGSIKEQTPSNLTVRDGIVSNVMVEGRRDIKEFGSNTIVLDSGTAVSGGVVAAEYVAAGGAISGEKHGGSSLVAKGYRGGDAAALARVVKDDVIRVKIVGDQFPAAFEREFKPRTTLYEVRRALQIQERISGKIVIKRRREILPDELTLAQAEVDGSTVNWKAEILE